MWRPLMAELTTTHLVIAPDLRGAGGSGKPDNGYDKKTMAQDIHALVRSLGGEQITITVPEADRVFYAAQYAQPGGIARRFRILQGVSAGRGRLRSVLEKKLSVPVLVLTGEKASGESLIEQGRLVATDVDSVVAKGSGHWLMEEAPGQVIPLLVEFISKPEQNSIM
jgi:pimeloyl-ACP methyl ester carboxylesterase